MKILKYVFLAFSLIIALTAFSQEINDAQIGTKLRELSNIRTQEELEKALSKLESSKSQLDRIYAFKFYNSNNDDVAADRVKINSLKKFPNGIFATYVALTRIAAMKDIQEKDKEYTKLLSLYPDLDIGMDAMSMTLGFAAKGDTANMGKYLNRYVKYAKDPKGNSIDEIAIYPMLISTLSRIDPSLAKPYLYNSLSYYRQKLAKEVTVDNQGRYYQIVGLYVDLLFKEKKYEEAFQYLNTLKYEFLISKRMMPLNLDSKLLNTHLYTGRYADAFDALQMAYINGEGTSELKSNLTKAYLAKNKNNKNITNYFDSLEVVKDEVFLSSIYNKAINQAAPDFILKDINGKTVKLSDLKGKVVVLDFWATWCGPCKASFPSMQKVVNKYKNDKNVQFLFIHTWEKGTGDATENAKKYIVDNNYSFDVLMDLRQAKSGTSDVAASYNVKGIPTKIIIDVNGNMRFNTSGFSADEQKAIFELSTMIEFARKG